LCGKIIFVACKWIVRKIDSVHLGDPYICDEPCAALQMSMSGEESNEAMGAGNLLGDQAFISSVLSSVSFYLNKTSGFLQAK